MQPVFINVPRKLCLVIIMWLGEVLSASIKGSQCYKSPNGGTEFFHKDGPRDCNIFCNQQTKEFGGYDCSCCFESDSSISVSGQPWYFYVIAGYAAIVTIAFALFAVVVYIKRRRKYRRYQDTGNHENPQTNLQELVPISYCMANNLQAAQETSL